MKRLGLGLSTALCLIFTQGCIAMTVVDVAAGVTGATIGVAGDVVEGTYNVTTGAVGAVIPGDGDSDEDRPEDESDDY